MDAIDSALLSHLVRKSGIRRMSDCRLRQHSRSLAKRLGCDYRQLMNRLCERSARPSVAVIYAKTFCDEIMAAIRKKKLRVPTWKYGPGGNHILIKARRTEIFVGNDLCVFGGRSFTSPRAAASQISKLLV